MERSALFGFIKDLVSNVKKKNQDNPKVETAPPTVFEEMNRQVEQVETSQASTAGNDNLIDVLKKKMTEIQSKNEANPNEATADKSVFDDMLSQLDKVRMDHKMADIPEPEVSYTEVKPPVEATPAAPEVTYEEVAPAASGEVAEGTMAMINSMGGSLGLRQAPDMGSPQMNYRLPDNSLVTVLEYSDKSIILDGVKARWVKVTFDGNTGWTLESYLNFN